MTTVFVTGATGVLGRETVARLLESGHEVRALARNAERAAPISAMGAEPVVADIYDHDAMTGPWRAPTRSCTSRHAFLRPAKMRSASAWAENSRLRVEGTRVLVDAALAAGVGAWSRSRSRSSTATAAPSGSTSVRPSTRPWVCNRSSRSSTRSSDSRRR